MTPDTNKERADVLTELPFFLEERAGVWVVVGKCGGVAPASLHERVLWKSLHEALAAKAPAAEPVAAQGRFVTEKEWSNCDLTHHNHVQANLKAWPGYETRALYTTPPAPTEQWVSVAERLPEPHHEVLLALDGEHITFGCLMPNTGFWWEPCDEEKDDSKPTHWMPFPAPPQGAAKGE